MTGTTQHQQQTETSRPKEDAKAAEAAMMNHSGHNTPTKTKAPMVDANAAEDKVVGAVSAVSKGPADQPRASTSSVGSKTSSSKRETSSHNKRESDARHPFLQELVESSDDGEGEEGATTTVVPSKKQESLVTPSAVPASQALNPGAFAVENSMASMSPRPQSEQGDEEQVGSQSNTFVTTSVTARLVTDEDDNERLREELERMKSAPTAEVVQPEEDKGVSKNKIWAIIAISVLVITVVIIIVASVLASGGDNSASASHSGDHEDMFDEEPALVGSSTIAPTSTPPSSTTTSSSATTTELHQSTLATVLERGFIRCRVSSLEQMEGTGLSLDLCRALSAALFHGDPDRTDMPHYVFRDMWGAIANGTVDVSTGPVTFHMGRDVFMPFSRKPMSFSRPWYYTGVAVAGEAEMVECANRGDTLTGVCKDLVVCTNEGTTTTEVIRDHLDGSGIHFVVDSVDMFEELAQGKCNVLSGEPESIYESRVREAGYTGEYVVSDTLLSKEPLAILTRGDDPAWTDFVNAVLQALLTAEAENITQANANMFPQTSLFGDDFRDMFRDTIAAVGNWGEMFDRSLGLVVERSGPNLLNLDVQNASGLMFSPPLSDLDFNRQFQQEPVPAVLANDTLEAVGNRKYLRCGIFINRPGFADQTSVGAAAKFSGLDIDLCGCLSAALFADPNMVQVEFVPLVDEVAGFMALSDDRVDVVFGVEYTLEADIQEPTTKEGYEFSPVYFYGEDGEMLTMVTNQNSTQWSDFVRWTIYGLIYAEEHNISTEDAATMPSVDLFGPEYAQMLRLMVLNFGNYGDLYERNLEGLIPRQGHNKLNDGSTPLIHPLPIEYFV
ncbi:Putative amino-acid ABC transporter-binding protein YhdW [Seminavis robusta]|uniref:Amino-acid ABC transporter-binding protein YhdW n=1 Tax=Seminavis robusta TaxID=568900 RepID=A0A9N8EXZ4_9STRA|nr:Putative amino-acid ABC transporter-binding protein YhdW [Seminavis robusta]|eukprot:Sro2784_g336990.1 Putative amino-acid ABC transporter-binding protein YhdW (840) ;mRNA; f:5585-8104